MSDLRDLLRYRQLILALTSRDLKARYRGSVLGFFWSLANPLLLLGVYTLVFTRFFPRPGISPYPVFLFVGILPWTFFAGSVMESTTSIVSNAGLVKKVMFPAEALPIVVVLSHLVHFALAMPILFVAIAIAVFLGAMKVSLFLLLVPFLLLLQAIFVAGVALVVSSASVLFRDLRDLIANLLQLFFFLTPILYVLPHIQSPSIRVMLRLNPMTPFILAYQNVFFFARAPQPVDSLLILVYTLISITLGFVVFDRLRDPLAEVI